MKQNIEIVRGTTNAFEIPITDADGNPYTLNDGETFVFALKRHYKGSERVLIKTITEGENGVYSLILKPSDTIDLECGRYYYDVGLQMGNDFFPVIPISQFDIKPNVSKWGDAN